MINLKFRVINIDPCDLEMYYDGFVVGLVDLSLQVGYYVFDVALWKD
jgi:hypothetical protein